MHIQSNVPLSQYSTMRLGNTTNALVTVKTKDELVEALNWANDHTLPLLVIGSGSNIIFQDGYPGLIIVNHLSGFDVIKDTTDNTVIQVAAGEVWDDIVARTVAMNLSGIEKLSLIPGTAGATPVQNVGAYGAEIADTLVELEAYDLQERRFTKLTKEACRFTYRNSIFKTVTERRYVITSITLELSKKPPKQPFYDTLQRYLDEHDIHTYTPQVIRDAVIAIRAIRLPDPATIPNTGSFFKNPIITMEAFSALERTYPDIPHWPAENGIKLSAGWLIEQAGLKGYASHGMRIYEHNALVFVNDHAKAYEDLSAFREEIVQSVRRKFKVTLEQEPELI